MDLKATDVTTGPTTGTDPGKPEATKALASLPVLQEPEACKNGAATAVLSAVDVEGLTAKDVLAFVNRFLVVNYQKTSDYKRTSSQGSALVRILAALRGPDHSGYEAKIDRTAVVRRAALPALELYGYTIAPVGAGGYRYDPYVSARTTRPSKFRKPSKKDVEASQHFERHVYDAAQLLGLVDEGMESPFWSKIPTRD